MECLPPTEILNFPKALPAIDASRKNWALALRGAVLALVAVVLLNQFLHHIQPRALLKPYSLDHNQVAFMLSEPGTWNLEHSVERFHTYGPLYRFFKHSVGPHSEDAHFGVKFLAFIWALILILPLLWKTHWGGILVAFCSVCLFEFPFYHQFPLLMWIWTLAIWKSNSEERRLWLIWSGIYSGFLLDYKFSWGVAAILQTGMTIICFEKGRLSITRAFLLWGLTAVISSLLFYILSTGTVFPFWDYIRFSLLDTSSYSESMVQMQTRSWSSALWYPIFVLLTLGVSCFFSRYYRRLMLSALPLIFVLFKYSWSRADYENTRMFVCYIPFFLIWCWVVSPLKIKPIIFCVFFFGVTYLAGSNMMSKATYPQFATRDIHFGLFLRHSEIFSQNLKASKEAFEEGIRPIRDESRKIIGDLPLISLPTQTHLAFASSKPRIIPSTQYFFRFKDDVLVKRDLKLLNREPTAVLFEDQLLHDQAPMSFGRKFFETILLNHDVIKLTPPRYLFVPRKQPRSWFKRQVMTLSEGEGSKRSYTFSEDPNVLLHIKMTNLKGLLYNLRRTLIKGDRLVIEHRSTGHYRRYEVPVEILQEGLLIYRELSATGIETDPVEQEIRLLGFISEATPYDYSHYFSGLNKDFDMSLEAWSFKTAQVPVP